jgi:hypothetical protein
MANRGRPKGVKDQTKRTTTEETKRGFLEARGLPEYKQWMSALLRKAPKEECKQLRRLWLEKRVLLPGWQMVGIAAKVRSLKKTAVGRKLCWTLSDEQAVKLVSGPCHYCGMPTRNLAPGDRVAETFRINGIDRVDSLRGYEHDNCVSCCGQCNIAKFTYSRDVFLEWVRRVATYQGLLPCVVLPEEQMRNRRPHMRPVSELI